MGNDLSKNDSTSDLSPVSGVQAPSRPFLITLSFTALVTAMTVYILGWYTGLRVVAHSALIGIAVFALLPFAIMAFGVALMLILAALSVLAALFGEGGGAGGEEMVAEPFLRIVAWILRPYYRWLGGMRHPVFWGVALGTLLGGLILGFMLWFVIIPGEASTVEVLTRLRQDLDAVYKEKGRYPQPDVNGHLPKSELDSTASGVVLDGFGRPIQYQVKGAWKLASYRLRSLGYDGTRGADDLCLSDATKLRKWADAIKFQKDENGKIRISVTAKLTGIQDMRCED